MAWLILLIIAWGALAFGAIYDWARWPLIVLCAAAGVWGLAREQVSRERRRVNRPILLGLVLVALAVASNWSRSRAARFAAGAPRRMSS